MFVLNSNMCLITKKNVLALLLILFIAGLACASNIEGTDTYKDYLFILVHGMNAKQGIFEGKDPYGNLKAYLENNLGLKGRVYAYTFNDINGSNRDHAKEFADPTNTNNWLKRAKEEFIRYIADKKYRGDVSRVTSSEIPSKYIILAHSMGHLAVRSYIYSDTVFANEGGGFYQDDIAKVVFISPPFLGSDQVMASLGFWLSATGKDYNEIQELYQGKNDKWTDVVLGGPTKARLIDLELGVKWQEIWETLQNANSDNPFYAYFAGANVVGMQIWSDQIWKNKFGYTASYFWWPCLYDLLPYDTPIYKPLTSILVDAKLSDSTKEPAYSIVYGSGIPVSDWKLSLAVMGIKFKNDEYEYNKATGAAERGYDSFIKYDSPLSLGVSLNYGLLSLPLLGQFKTNQGKVMSVTLASILDTGFMTNDGDGLVPVYSARGENISHLKNAQRHEHIFKTERYEKYLSEQLPQEVVVTEVAIATAAGFVAWSGTPYIVAWKNLWWMRIPVALSLISQTQNNINSIQWDIEAHGHILEQYDLIKTAILDTPAILTIEDIQARLSVEAGVSPEAEALTFSAAAVPPADCESLKVRSITENRQATGSINLPVPMTLKVLAAAGEGERKYVTSMTVTKPPKRIAGRLNYLFPKLMKQFEYSFNFANWKPIENVNPETGEFVLEDLPFAEGQNVIAVRSENAVGIKSHQLLKIVLNTIPLLPSKFSPIVNSYIADANPNVSVEFNKSEYSGNYENEKISIKGMRIDGEEVSPNVVATMESYHPIAKVSYKIPTDKPLTDGEHQVVVVAESNVGVSQAIWSFNVDRGPPTITMETLQPYSPRAPTTIRYTASDEVSPNLLSVRCDLYLTNNTSASGGLQLTTDNFIANIATAESISKGETFFQWTGDNEQRTGKVPDGNYKLKIKAFDLAGNSAVAEQPIAIDSTPPIIAGVNIEPLPMTSNSSELRLAARVDEKSTVIIKLINNTTNTTTAYLTQAKEEQVASSKGGGYIATYTWDYNNTLSKPPADGIYRVELIARDEAGNESATKTVEAVRIDRTPPVIYGQIAQPYVLSNIGKDAYKTTLSFNVDQASKIKIKVYNANTGQPIGSPWNLTTERSIVFDGSDPELYPKGSYRFQIIAEDDVGNIGVAYTSCVKDGIAPVISFPAEDNVEVSGTIAIRGTAIDPDWTNTLPFKNYRVYYKQGRQSAVAGPGLDWQTDFIEVPPINRAPNRAKNISLRPVQNDATLAYLYADNLENGDYTILLIADEEGGDSLAAVRVVKINNNSLGGSNLSKPYIKLNKLPTAIDFKSDNSVKLPLGFINSIKPANVYVEVARKKVASSKGEEEIVFAKYFPNVVGAPFVGKPDYKSGSDLGYFIWSDETGYHLRWSTNGTNHKFSGNIVLVGSDNFADLKQIGGGIKVQSPLISWDTTIAGGEGGIDFKVASGQLLISPKIDEDPANPSIYTSDVYLGAAKYSQQYLPIVIDVASQQLVDLASLGKVNSSKAPAGGLQSVLCKIDWDGKLATGGYADNGDYFIRVRAEGVDGLGVATDEAVLAVTTPFDLQLKEITPADKQFNPIGLPDRLAAFFNVSKDAIISAAVYDENGQYVASLVKGAEVLGNTNPTHPFNICWRGNYPDPDSGQVVNGGNYKIVLQVTTKDGSASRTETIDRIRITTSIINDQLKIEPIGQEVDYFNGVGLEKIRLAAGESPYSVEIKGIGKYFPPKDFNYTITASGEQQITAYPFVPFAALMHRGFKGVDVQVEVSAKIEMTAYGYEVFKGWKGYGKSDTRIYTKIFNIHQDRPNELHQISDSFTVGDIHRANVQTGLGEPWPHVDRVNFTIVVRPAHDPSWILDCVTIEADDNVNRDTVKYTTAKLTEKGIFRIEPTWSGWGGEKFGSKASFTLKFDLEDALEYSRLTNRFVPWIGFVSLKTPANEKQNFSGYLNDLSKLGFPGQSYFTGTTAKTTTAPHKGSFNTALFPGKTDSLKTTVGSQDIPKSTQINSDSSSKMTGTASDYSTYLSDEYLEFIPITAPENGWYEYGGNKIIGQKFSLSPGEKVFPITAKTELYYSYNGEGGRKSPFTFSWPWRENEKDKFNDEQNIKKTKLEANPQQYTGPTKDGTFWALDDNQIAQRKTEQVSLKLESGQLRFDRGAGRKTWQAKQSLGELLCVPNYVDVKFAVSGNTFGVTISPTTGERNTKIRAEDADTMGIDWTTKDDNNLVPTGGLIKSGALEFNPDGFYGTKEQKIISLYPLNNDDWRSAVARQYAFLKRHPFNEQNYNSPVDNPNLVINDWQIEVKDKTGASNKDLKLLGINKKEERLNDTFSLKLKLNASEARYIEILGAAPGPYQLLYFDGSVWQNIYESTENKVTSGRLAWWDVSRLNGQYTVLLRLNDGGYISTNVSIGTLVGHNIGGDVYSTYKRAQLKFPAGAFKQDQLVTITPVTMQQIFIRNRPIIMTTGPIVEIKPSPWQFTVSSLEGVDQRPTLRFIYTFDDLKELGMWDSKMANPNVGDKYGLPLNIHQVTAAGDLQIVSGNKQEVEQNNNEWQYVFYAPLDHFSTYALLKGKFQLSAPLVFADREITNKETVTVYGTAEPGSIVTIYVKDQPIVPDPSKSEPHNGRISAEAVSGEFRFENVKLINEGNNYIYVTSHLADDPVVRTYSDLTVVKDTIPPSVEATQNIYAFSPNNDGKYDSVEFGVRSSERGKLYFSVASLGSAVSGQLYSKEFSAEAHTEIKFNWDGAGLPDGNYRFTVYAIDEAGNISNNVAGQVVIDTTAPTILGLNVDPNPFTPNDDGIKDTTRFWYKLSEPAYVKCTVGSEQGTGRIFRENEGPTENFQYPTSPLSVVASGASVLSVGGWVWDGRGTRGELIGGNYTYQIVATDNVGNQVSSDARSLVVDCEPTLVPYLYAEPDPFSPVNPHNCYTEIKYYLARDQVKTSVAIIGEGKSVIKNLVNDEILDKGEHVVRWYGDFNPDYQGSKAIGNSNRVNDGSYEFKITATDLDGGKAANLTNTVLVDNTPPYISIKPLTVDYLNKRATVKFNLSEKATLEVKVVNNDGVTVAELVTNEAKAAGDYSLDYQFGQRPAEEKQYFQFTARDQAQNVAEGKSEIFSIQASPLEISGLVASPATFTPNGDGLSDITNIKYTLAGGIPEYLVNVEIHNSTGATVKRLAENDPQGNGSYSFVWDGKTDSGQLAPDGYFEGVIIVKDKQNTVVEKKTIILMISTQPTVSLAIDPIIFAPQSANEINSVNFSYSISYAVHYITQEALVKLEVLNSSSEAVWSKVFNKTAGNYVYQYDGLMDNGQPLPAGNYYVKASAEDALSSLAVPQIVQLTVDYTQPEPSDFTIQPTNAKLGTKVLITLNFPETLEADPLVALTFADGNISQPTKEAALDNSYQYSYLIGTAEAEGETVVTVSARDLALNPITKTKTFVVDKTKPEISNIEITPNPASIPAVSGSVKIKFQVSEPLNQAPMVYVTQNGATRQLVPVFGLWSSVSGLCEAKYDAFPGYDGTAQVSIEVADLALNMASSLASFEIDTVKPLFSQIQSEISSNSEFTKFAKEGSEVTIGFKASEPLKFNPEVRVNGVNSGQWTGKSGEEYVYKYTIQNSDVNGNAAIAIVGYDFAGNEGTAETDSSAESFVIDLENPIVKIATPEVVGSYISNPGKFSTNADPSGTVSRSTTFYYDLAEKAKVAVKVYKVDDAKTTYTKADFTAANLVATLINDIWQERGDHQVPWDGKSDLGEWVTPGKYAFIVEGRDRAGNLTLKKWGGTVWVQNNLLSLKWPEQLNNPDPPFISPNGNSTAEVQRRARLYFMIPTAPTPETTTKPERIEAMTVDGAYTKKVGTYSVRVYSDSGLTTLVRTITSEAVAWAGTLMHEDWDGKLANGDFAPDGTYYLVVDVRDYAGKPADNNLLTGSVVIDNTLPTVPQPSVSNYYFSGGSLVNNDPIKRTTEISYEANGSESTLNVQLEIFKDGNKTATLQSLTEKTANTLQQKTWSNEGYIADGLYTYRVTAFDQAGNSAFAEGTAVIDRSGPAGSITINGGDKYTITPAVTLTLLATDPVSGIDKVKFSDDGISWTSWEALTDSKPWSIPGADGDKTVFYRIADRAGNYADYSDSITLDTQDPYFTDGPRVEEINHTPINKWSSHTTPYFTFSASDVTSGVKGYEGFIDGLRQGLMDNYTISWHPSLTKEGIYTLKIRVYDNAGRYSDSSAKVFKIDLTGPSANTPSTSSPTKEKRPIWNWSTSSDDSGINGYFIKIGTYAGGDNIVSETWIGNVTSWQTTTDLDSGLYYTTLKASDEAGNVGIWGESGIVNVDLTSPQISDISASPNTISPANNDGNYDTITFNYKINEPATVSIYRDADILLNSTWKDAAGNYSYAFAPGPSLLTEGVHTYYIKAIDGVGNPSLTTTYSFSVDNTPPYFSSLSISPKKIIPDGSNNNATITFDNKESCTVSCDIYNNDYSKKIRALGVITSSFTWDGRKDDRTLADIGYYRFWFVATDSVGNATPAMRKVRVKSRDEVVFIDDNIGAAEDIRMIKVAPNLSSFECNVLLWEKMPGGDYQLCASAGDYMGDGRPLVADVIVDNNPTKSKICIYNPRNKTIIKTFDLTGSGDGYKIAAGFYASDTAKQLAVLGPDGIVHIYWPLTGAEITSFQTDCTELSAGDFDGDGWDEIAGISINADVIRLYRNFKSWEYNSFISIPKIGGPYTITCNDFDGDGADEIAFSSTSGNKICLYEADGTKIREINVNDGNWYEWIGSGDFNGDGIYEIAAASDVGTWMIIFGADGTKYQNRPTADRCRRLSCEDIDCSYSNTISTYSIKGATAQSSTLESPVLIAPEKDNQSVTTLRPIFEWKQRINNNQLPITNYQLAVAKNDGFTISPQTFTKSANTGSPDKTDPTILHFNYAINEFDPGLDRDTYYWKVTALATGEAATSEVWSFRITPDLTLTGITNYPNPFNPNRERTRIRYRLGADADEVKIRIYTITGQLVNELTGDTQGEQSSIWEKYNDVEWDGRNGRGDLVVNGIYPFEITARLGDKTVSGRGKIAVLK
jgi:flagellar hook assembly protein FlgD